MRRQKLSDKSKWVLFWDPASEYKGAKKPHFAPSRQPYTTVRKPSSYLSDSFRRGVLGNSVAETRDSRKLTFRHREFSKPESQQGAPNESGTFRGVCYFREMFC